MTTSPRRSPETRYGALTKLCMWSRVGDVINHVQFHLNRFSGFGPSGGSNFPISHWLCEWLLQQCYALTCYTVIAVIFSFMAALTCDLRRALCIIGFTLKGPPKWGFGVIFWVGAKMFGGKVHSSSELRVFRHLSSRSDAPSSNIMYGYSHLP